MKSLGVSIACIRIIRSWVRRRISRQILSTIILPSSCVVRVVGRPLFGCRYPHASRYQRGDVNGFIRLPVRR